ncbi:serine/threonine-protein kinase pakF [Lucilia cuprina]|uniref:serine/threonine-protein kinase pakF n=1 Tax=Lucilia cuprina TaxID=7375 RepID=UPI001F06B33F|nr:serine/threonine-protein kinase pakF [Lucilia cuprina]
MELHSYAKRRISKKWTIEQKRKLVEARIAHDAWFTNKPSSVVPWKNILIAANLDDFNVFFVRKQWSNMLTRYKQYKQTRLGNIASKTIDAELIKRINQEWEFFGAIHAFMTRKTTNLHSYALTHRTENSNNEHLEQTGEEELIQTSSRITEQEQQNQTTTIKTPTKLLHNETIIIQKDCAKENIPNNTTVVIQANTSNNNNNNNNISIDDGIHLFSSDTNDEFQIITETTRIINGSMGQCEDEDENMNCVRNTDHDFYSKRSSLADMVGEVKRHEDDELQEQQSNYFADASEESQGSLNMVVDILQTNIHTTNDLSPLNMLTVRDGNGQTFEIKSENITQTESLVIKEEIHDQAFLNDMPSTSTQSRQTHNMQQQPNSNSSASTTKNRLSERDKYYRHKRRFNRRLEKRFDAILQVMGQIVKVEYPNVDVTPLVGTVTSVTSSLGKVLSSDSEDDDDDVSNQSDDSNLNIPKATHGNH